jgi:hypothetical protein
MECVAKGYSGMGSGKDNPYMENVRDWGPIPRGRYRIGPPHHNAKYGPKTLDLTPIGHNALRRTDFKIHGESSEHAGRASIGCIILGPQIRQQIADTTMMS